MHVVKITEKQVFSLVRTPLCAQYFVKQPVVENECDEREKHKKTPCSFLQGVLFFGVIEGARTPDPQNHNLML